MPRKFDPHRIPPLLLHKSTGQARARFGGKYVYLGKHGSPEAARRYGELLQQQFKGVGVVPAAEAPSNGSEVISVNELCLRFVTERLPQYVTSGGRPSAEQDCFKGVIRHLRKIFGETPVVEFGPLKLRIVREAMIAADWSRNFVNKQVGRLRYLFRWGVSWELVPFQVADAMKSVQALKPGESEARETVPRLAVPEPHIQVVRAILCPLYRDILDLLLLTGARPGELLSLSEQMIDRSGTIWRSDLREHKNAKRGKSRTLFFNSTAQEILKRYLVEKPDQKLFSVRRDSYSKAVAKACDTADVPRFVPHQLRHCVATRLVDDLGTEVAQRLLGHSDRMMTEHYSKSADKQAQQAVQHLAETYRPQ